jgi:hypothetical protein
MKALAAVLAVLALSLLSMGTAHAETAIGAVFGYPGNVGLSMRFDRTPVNVAWSDNLAWACPAAMWPGADERQQWQDESVDRASTPPFLRTARTTSSLAVRLPVFSTRVETELFAAGPEHQSSSTTSTSRAEASASDSSSESDHVQPSRRTSFSVTTMMRVGSRGPGCWPDRDDAIMPCARRRPARRRIRHFAERRQLSLENKPWKGLRRDAQAHVHISCLQPHAVLRGQGRERGLTADWRVIEGTSTRKT